MNLYLDTKRWNKTDTSALRITSSVFLFALLHDALIRDFRKKNPFKYLTSVGGSYLLFNYFGWCLGVVGGLSQMICIYITSLHWIAFATASILPECICPLRPGLSSKRRRKKSTTSSVWLWRRRGTTASGTISPWYPLHIPHKRPHHVIIYDSVERPSLLRGIIKHNVMTRVLPLGFLGIGAYTGNHKVRIGNSYLHCFPWLACALRTLGMWRTLSFLRMNRKSNSDPGRTVAMLMVNHLSLPHQSSSLHWCGTPRSGNPSLPWSCRRLPCTRRKLGLQKPESTQND